MNTYELPAEELSNWSSQLRLIVQDIDAVISRRGVTWDEDAKAAMLDARATADVLRDGIIKLIGEEDPMLSSSGLLEDNRRIEVHRRILLDYLRAWRKQYFPTVQI